LFTVLFLFCAGSAQAVMQTITLDTDFSDWVSVPSITDPSMDGVSNYLDIVEFKVCNDDENLYFYVRINDGGNIAGLQFGASSRVDYMDILIDTDNNASTGTLIGPAGYQVGTDWTVSAFRRVSSSSRAASVIYGGAHTGTNADSIAGTYTGIGDNSGLAPVTVTTGVYAFEQRMSLDLSSVDGPILGVGDTITFAVASSRSGTDSAAGIMDWLDTSISYTIVPEPATLVIFAFGSMVLFRKKSKL
jgi:hypothetical protein